MGYKKNKNKSPTYKPIWDVKEKKKATDRKQEPLPAITRSSELLLACLIKIYSLSFLQNSINQYSMLHPAASLMSFDLRLEAGRKG